MNTCKVHQFPDSPLHHAITKTLSQLQWDYTERRPQTAKVYFIDDLVLYRCWGILSRAEIQLVQDDPEGARMVKELIEQQWTRLMPLIQTAIQNHTNKRALGVSVSLSPEEDELVILCRVHGMVGEV